MNLVTIALSLALTAGNLCTVSGRVHDENGEPVPGAAVYLEQGIEGTVHQTRAAHDGSYSFEGVMPGVVGLVAHQAGHAWGGKSVSLGLGQKLQGVDLELGRPEKISGHVKAGKKRPVSGARITRVALLMNQPVSIPFAKLKHLGVHEPATDSSGAFTVADLPRGATVALKIAHPRYAQARAGQLRAGDRSVEVTLYEGVLISGVVLAAGTDRPVARATVQIRNANPPHDTAIARSDSQGNFGLRILPGNYLYKAGGATYESGGWRPMLITGELPIKQLKLYVTGAGRVRGKVMDAQSGAPVEHVRLLLETDGRPAAMVRTGPSGEFELTAKAGSNVIRIDAAPGYLPPIGAGTRFTLPEGEVLELPSFWLAPIPAYELKVVDAAGEALPGAVVRLLRPAQFGWRQTNEAGMVELRFLNLPADGRIVGLAEHPSKAQAAIFAIGRDGATGAIVQLLPLASASGKVVNENGRPIEGAVVDGRFLDETLAEPILIWRAVTDRHGAFQAGVVPAQVPQVCVAYTVDKGLAKLDQSPAATFIAAPEESRRLDDFVVPGKGGGRSLRGTRLRWSQYKKLCGPDPGDNEAAIVTFCGADEAEAIVDSLNAAQEILGPRLRTVVVVDGDFTCSSGKVSVRAGKRPGVATTYVVDRDRLVRLETFGLPPLESLRGL